MIKALCCTQGIKMLCFDPQTAHILDGMSDHARDLFKIFVSLGKASY